MDLHHHQQRLEVLNLDLVSERVLAVDWEVSEGKLPQVDSVLVEVWVDSVPLQVNSHLVEHLHLVQEEGLEYHNNSNWDNSNNRLENRLFGFLF